MRIIAFILSKEKNYKVSDSWSKRLAQRKVFKNLRGKGSVEPQTKDIGGRNMDHFNRSLVQYFGLIFLLA